MKKTQRRNRPLGRADDKRGFPGKRSLLSQAIALAGAGMAAPAMAASCLVTSPTAVTCVLSAADAATVTSTGSIVVVGGPAINVTGAGVTVSITNDGTISSDQVAIDSQADAAGTLSIMNNTGGVISGASGAIFVADDLSGSVDNAGSIIASGTGSAFGIGLSGDLSGIIDNSGTISSTADNAGGGADAVAVSVDGMNGGTFTNSGGMSATALGSSVSATGVDINSGVDSASVVNNSGTISATATATNTTSASASAYGVYVSYTFAGTFTNDGSISAAASAVADTSYSADAYAVGVEFGYSVSGAAITNTGSITANANAGEASATGMLLYYSMDTDTSIVNSGTISATAVATTDDATAYGLYVDDYFYGTIDNSGTITATATGEFGASATGIYLSSTMYTGSSLTNSGTITATATGANNDADAIGVYMYDMQSATFDNTATGVISATASGDYATATGVLVYYTLDTGSTVTNAGSITATATAATESATAYGVYVDDYFYGTMDNSGTITATASGATEASAIGVYLSSAMYTGSSLTNSGTITATATATSSDAEAGGVFIYDMSSATFTNTATGAISATASGDYVTAAGIAVNGDIDAGSSLTNAGSVTATATAATESATAYGIFVDDDVLGVLDNSGSITATANGETDAEAYGLLVSAIGMDATVSNSGTIDVTATGGSNVEAIGIDAGLVWGMLSSSGTIDVSASGPALGTAAGIAVDTLGSGASLTNSGTITATLSANAASSLVPLAAGIYVGSLATGSSLSNSGTVSASATGVGVEHWSIFVAAGNDNTVSNTGTIASQMNLVGASLTSSGTVSIPVGQTGLIGNDYTQTAGGVFEVGVLSANSGDYGRLVVTGTADISASDQLAVDVSANDMLVDQAVVEDVLSAGTLITGGNMTVSDNSALWAFSAIDDGANNIDLVVDRALFVADAVIATGPAWALGAAQSIDKVISDGPTGDMVSVIGELSTLSTVDQVSVAATQLVPVLVGQSSKAANLSVSDVANAISTRMLNRGVGAEESDQDKHVWIRMFGSKAEQDDEPTAAGFEMDNSGVVLGFDSAIGDSWSLGMAMGFSKPDVDSDSPLINHEIEIEGYQFAAYADWTSESASFVELIGVIGFNENESKRLINFAGLNRAAKGEYDSWYAHLYGSWGYSFAVSDNFTFSPVAHLGYTKVDEDSYVETGAGDLNLDVRSNDDESLILGLDGRGAYRISDNGSQITGFVGIGYDMITDDAELDASFVGGGPVFTTISDQADELVIRAGLGVEWVVGDRGELHVRYSYESRDEFSDQLLTATFRWAL